MERIQRFLILSSRPCSDTSRLFVGVRKGYISNATLSMQIYSGTISPPHISTGFFEMLGHRTVGHTHTIFSQNEFFWHVFFNSVRFSENEFFSAKFFKIRVKSVKKRLFFGWRAWKFVMRSKRSKLVTVWKSFPLPVFMGGVSKSFFFLSDTSQALYFV